MEIKNKQMELHQYFRLFASCMPVKGAARSIICDLGRGLIEFIPNDLYDLLLESSTNSLQEVIDKYGEENRELILEYFQFLLDKQFIFLCEEEELDWFPELPLERHTPHYIENAIIDTGEKLHNYGVLFSQLNILGCRALELRFFSARSADEIIHILDLLNNSRIEDVQVLLPYEDGLDVRALLAYSMQNARLRQIVVHSTPAQAQKVVDDTLIAKLFYVQEVVDSADHCGFIHPTYFSIHKDLFVESKLWNNCLNQKISVDTEGRIKNCPAFTHDFGVVDEDTTLVDVAQNRAFQKVWGISKDEIEVCRDCEFRYVCTDCRAFVKDSENPLSKPKKCTYDPYTATWQSDN